MQPRLIAGQQVNPLGFGCMNVSHAYTPALEDSESIKVLQHAFDAGVRNFDTAALYGFGKNEILVGEALKNVRHQIFLGSKCGLSMNEAGRVIDSRPETLFKTIDNSLKSLQTDYLDLYTIHRFDKKVPIEESIGAMARMVEMGKIRAIGLSEVSGDTIKKANKVHKIAAVQNEYSLWSRNAELGALAATIEIGAAFVAFSPVARGFLAGGVLKNEFTKGDIRKGMPRFQSPNFEENLKLYFEFEKIAKDAGVTPAQLSLAWVLAQSDNIHVIPGSTSIAHIDENMNTKMVDEKYLAQASDLINQKTVVGARYSQANQADIDTEEF